MDKPGKVTGVRFLRVNRLIDDLRRERVDQTLSYKYLLGLMILHHLAMASGSSLRLELPQLLAWWAVTIGLVILELRWCQVTNKKGDNRDFVKRYIAISFVIELILGVFSMAASLILVVGIAALFSDVVRDLGLEMAFIIPYFSLLVGVLARLVFIFWKVHSFRTVSKPLTV